METQHFDRFDDPVVAADVAHHLHPFTDYAEMREKGTRIITHD